MPDNETCVRSHRKGRRAPQATLTADHLPLNPMAKTNAQCERSLVFKEVVQQMHFAVPLSWGIFEIFKIKSKQHTLNYNF